MRKKKAKQQDDVEQAASALTSSDGVEQAAPSLASDNGDRADHWQNCEQVRRTRDLSQLKHDLETGWSAVDDIDLAKTAVALVQTLRAEGVTGWSWPPCPT